MSSPLVLRRLYRSLLKSAKPFTERSSRGVALNCLLHRTGVEDLLYDEEGSSIEGFLRASHTEDPGNDEDPELHRLLFRKLLRQVIAGGDDASNVRQMQFPIHVRQQLGNEQDIPMLLQVIRREFRAETAETKDTTNDSKSKKTGDTALSSKYPLKTRRETAFLALREINRKLTWAETLIGKQQKPQQSEPSSTMISATIHVHPQQAARGVSPLPLAPPSSYLRPGAYLIAHPNLSGYFRRTVICILDHQDEDETPDGTAGHGPSSSNYGTYGLIINRMSLSPRLNGSENRKDTAMTLGEVLRPVPTELADAFGKSAVKEGGPVHMSLQMLHAATPNQEAELKIGGHVLPTIEYDDTATGPLVSNAKQQAQNSGRTIYYRGDIVRAANAVTSSRLDREDVSFFIGASSWTTGQLESEIERGCWLPCRGPTEIALSGICDHEPTEKGKPRPKADLWLSMLSACGEDEAVLAHLVYNDDGEDDLGAACDDPCT